MPLRVEHPLGDLARQLEPAHALVDGVDVLDARDEARRVVVAQVLADAGERVPHRDAERLQQLRRADAGELQQLRRIVGAAGQDHLAPRAHLARPCRRARPCSIAHADRALALQHEVVACARVRTCRFGRRMAGCRNARGGADAAAVLDGALGVGDAFLDRRRCSRGCAGCRGSPRRR